MTMDSSARLHALGRKITELRKAKGWSQEAFAMEAALDRSYIGSIERGERNITFETLCTLAATLGVDLPDLLDGI